MRRLALEVQELHRQDDPALAVGDGVVQPLQHRCATVLEALDGDELPQRALAVQRLAAQRRHEVVQVATCPVAAEVHPAQVVVQIHVGVLDPSWELPGKRAGHDTLTESRDGADRPLHA